MGYEAIMGNNSGDNDSEDGRSPVADAASASPALRQGRCIGVFVAVAAVLSLPLLFTTGAAWQALYGGYLIEALILIPLLGLLMMRRRHSEDRCESRFWLLLTLGFSMWLIVIPLGAWLGVAFSDHMHIKKSVAELLYLMFYGAIIAALQTHPHVEHDPVTYPLRILEWSGTLVLSVCLLLYFVAVPTMLDGEFKGFRSASLTLWVALDVYLVVWLWHLREVADRKMWRNTYSWLLAGTALWGIGDLLTLLIHEDVIPDPGSGTPFDLIWLVAFCAVVKSTDYGHNAVAETHLSPRAKAPLGIGPLALYTAVPLLMHTLLYRFGNPEPQFQALREGVALAATVILSGMALFYHRRFREENKRLAAEEFRAREALAHQAFHDELTGLPNRLLFTDRLHMAIADAVRNNHQCAVLFCDLDQFKVINDSLGHEAGDQALTTTAQRLTDAVRQKDTVSRLSGDEFAVLLTGIQDSQDAGDFARKLLEGLGEPMMLADKKHSLTASIGVAVFPEDGSSEEELLKHADTAMYQSKIHGRNTYRLFTEAMNNAAKERAIIEQGLKTGLLEDQFAVFYQPIVSLDSGHAAGYEALVRWRDPERGYVAPASFIDVAEQSGLIVPIGRWVLESACAWVVNHPPVNGAPRGISVNVSPRQLREPDMVAHVSSVLQDTGLDPARLQLEITESAVLEMGDCLDTMRSLRELGLSIAIDDFGTGCSTLSGLHDMPVDTIKIDRFFVQDIERNSVSEAIVQAVVSMADAMGLTVVAEGVESKSELAVITRARCDAAQGYYFCKPLAADELSGWFSERPELPGEGCGP